MLTRLFIRDFALIRELEIEFCADLTVLTGETGAGKSIILGALNSILGGVARGNMVRDGADRCVVEGLFEFADGSAVIKRLAATGLTLDDNQLALRREILSGGRSRAFVNGLSIPLKKLRELGSSLVDVHGQHEHQSLLRVDRHAAYLDAFGGLTANTEALADLYREYGSAESALRELRQQKRRYEEAKELREFQLGEIRALDPKAGEDAAIEQELTVLENGELIRQVTSQLADALYQADGSIVEQIGRLRRELDQVAAFDRNLASRTEQIQGLIYGIEELSADLLSYSENLDSDPERLAHLRDRLDVLRQMVSKYGGTLDRLIAFAAELQVGEAKSEALDEEISAGATTLDRLARQYSIVCLELSAAREHAAENLVAQVEAGLRSLGAPKAVFEVRLDTRPDPEGMVEKDGVRVHADESGIEHVEFFLSTNPGEVPKPLANVGSGGELSRIMLILRELIATGDGVSTLVFDEIDTGISGRMAAAVGKKLKSLAASHQVVVITHLPQIASLADQHMAVRKRPVDGRMVTSVRVLEDEERTEEIAQLLAGEEISASAREHAQRMLG
jgi:DNA repair protein RecN (Recombination protein N)